MVIIGLTIGTCILLSLILLFGGVFRCRICKEKKGFINYMYIDPWEEMIVFPTCYGCWSIYRDLKYNQIKQTTKDDEYLKKLKKELTSLKGNKKEG